MSLFVAQNVYWQLKENRPMQLPSQLEQRRFLEWNYLVKGLMQVWEIARLLEREAHLEQLLQNDGDGALMDRLAHLGNQLCPVFDYLRMCDYLQQDILLVHQALSIASASTQTVPALRAMTEALSYFEETPRSLLLNCASETAG
jgi:hypothetical protein